MVVFMFHLMLPFMSLVKLEEIEKKNKKNGVNYTNLSWTDFKNSNTIWIIWTKEAAQNLKDTRLKFIRSIERISSWKSFRIRND